MSIYIPKEALQSLSIKRQIQLQQSLLQANRNNSVHEEPKARDKVSYTKHLGITTTRIGETELAVRAINIPINGYSFGVCVEQSDSQAVTLTVLYKHHPTSYWQYLYQVPVHLGIIDTIDAAQTVLENALQDINRMVKDVFHNTEEEDVVEWFLSAIDNALTTDGTKFILDFSNSTQKESS